MALTLVLGPANSAKAGEVLGAYRAAAGRGALLVVPTAQDVRHYARELATEAAVLGGAVLTFSGLAEEVARRAGYTARRLSGVQRERVLRRVVSRARLRVLAASSTARGFSAAVGGLVSELERSLVTPQRFAQALGAWAAGDPERSAYAEEVASLYIGYARELDRLGRVDSDLYAWRALDALRESPGRWGAGPVFFYGFDDLHPLERDAVETLSRIAGAQVTVSLTYEAGRAALAARAGVVEDLRPIATTVLELAGAEDHYAPGARAALHHLERHLFEPVGGESGAPRRIDPGEAAGLLEAGGERAEAELVAAEVLALLRAGIPGEEIVLVHRSPAASAPLIERVFAAAGLSVAVEYRIPFGHTTLGRGLLALCRCALLGGRATAEDLLDYLRTPGLLERAEVADALEAEVRRGGLHTSEQARAQLGWKLGEIEALASSTDLLGELARQGRRLFAAPHRGAAALLGADERRDARALATLLRALADLEELGDRPSGSDLISVIEGLRVQAGTDARPGAVLIAEPLAIRARRFRAVFMCGLQEGMFPSPAIPEPFLPDERRRELAAASGLRLRLREDTLASERYLFYACVSRATERVILSYRSSDEEGNLALRSPFVEDVAELMAPEWNERRRRRLLADVVWEEGSAPTPREEARARAAGEVRGGAGLGARAQHRAEPPRRALGDAALEHVRHTKILSPGALESYADCPVRWLVEKELDPRRLEPEPEPIARGNYMHAALEQLLSRLAKPVTPGSLSEAQRILGEVIAQLPAAVASGRPPAVREGVLRRIEADLRRYLEHEAAVDCGWPVGGLELRFGFTDDEGSLPALELGDGAGPERVRVRGTIDRVDVQGPGPGARAIVRDYKSGVKNDGHRGDRWREEHQLQVALYMIAVRELLGAEPVAGFYQPLGGRDLRARGVFLAGAPVGERTYDNDGRDQAGLDGELEHAERLALALAARLRAGELTPCPETCSRDGCRYPGICRS